MKRGTIIIPQSGLDAQVAELARLRLEAWRMLGELELAATGRRPAPAGAWRHDPAGWLRLHDDTARTGGTETAG